MVPPRKPIFRAGEGSEEKLKKSKKILVVSQKIEDFHKPEWTVKFSQGLDLRDKTNLYENKKK